MSVSLRLPLFQKIKQNLDFVVDRFESDDSEDYLHRYQVENVKDM